MCHYRNVSDAFVVSNLETEEINEIDDTFNEKECNNLLYFAEVIATTTKTHHHDVDAASCYYSASASHTDNNCSTDEHDPLVLNIGLHSSDSGADISEYQTSSSSKLKRVAANKKARQPLAAAAVDENFPIERNNSLPEAFGSAELNQPWDKFWADNGERLIWASWIGKYSDYINPNYTKFVAVEETAISVVQNAGINRSKFSFDNSNINEIVSSGGNKTEIVISSCSPAANTGDHHTEDGWNPLSPASVDETWTVRRSNAIDTTAATTTVADIMLSPRCESVTSSIPLTIGTTDSMTNVTHMTISSYDFGHHSSVCSPLSDSNSSADLLSTSSSDSSSSQPIGDEDDDDDTAAKDLFLGGDVDDAMDSDQHWQILWQKHFQEQYAKQYKAFMDASDLERCPLSSSFQSESTTFADAAAADVLPRRNASRRRGRKCLSDKLSNLNLHCASATTTTTDGTTEPETQNNSTTENVVEVDSSSNAMMMAMGLPTAFGASSGAGGGGDGNENRPINLKRR